MQEFAAGKFHFEPPFTSFDHLVGEREQLVRHGETERLSRKLYFGGNILQKSGAAAPEEGNHRLKFYVPPAVEKCLELASNARWLPDPPRVLVVFAQHERRDFGACHGKSCVNA